MNRVDGAAPLCPDCLVASVFLLDAGFLLTLYAGADHARGHTRSGPPVGLHCHLQARPGALRRGGGRFSADADRGMVH